MDHRDMPRRRRRTPPPARCQLFVAPVSVTSGASARRRTPWHRRGRALLGTIAAGVLVSYAFGGLGFSETVAKTQYSAPSAYTSLSNKPLDQTTVTGVLRAPGGPDMVDSFGRTVFFHGVNAVYKRRPYELYVDPGKPWNFDANDARRIAALGFNVVRLGILWQA